MYTTKTRDIVYAEEIVAIIGQDIWALIVRARGGIL